MIEQNQVKKNLIYNVLSLTANIGIGLYYTPYLVKTLGIVAYGVIPLALIINQYISVLTGSLTSSLTRFYSIALQKSDYKQASKYFSTSLFVIFALIAVLIIPLHFIVEKIDHWFTIPTKLLADSKTLFRFTILSFFLSLVTSIFNITLYAYNRLDVLNIVKVLRVVCKFIFVFALFNFLEINIAYVGISNFISELIILIFSIIFFWNFTKGRVIINLKSFSKSAFTSVSLMATWVVIQQLGDTGIYRIDTILLNIFWSTKESAVLGAFTELGTYAILISSVIGSLFGPIILNAYANDDHKKVKEFTLDRSLSVGVIVAVMIGSLSGYANVILELWLGEQFVSYSHWLYLKLFLIPFYSAAGVFAFAARAWNKVKFIAIVTVFIGVVNFISSYVIGDQFKSVKYSIEIILTIGLLLGILQSYFLNGLYFSKLYIGTKKVVYINFFKILFTLLFVTSISYFFSKFLNVDNKVLSISLILMSSFILLLFSVKVNLSKMQIKELLKLVNTKI